jgi:outer membrane protein OmpA-like peptidoglycan-associated protein
MLSKSGRRTSEPDKEKTMQMWKVVPCILAASLLTGCAGMSKSYVPLCAAAGGAVGAGIGATESSAYAGWGALIVGAGAAITCYQASKAGEEVAVVEETPPPAPAPAPAPEPTEAVRVELDVKFDFDKSVVKEESYGDIKAVADFLKQYPQTTTVVEGHTDSVGTDKYNQGLSERRANAVRDVLVNQYGIDGSRINAVGYGESKPVADNKTDDGRAINRRVEASVEATP